MALKDNLVKGNPDLCVHFWMIEQAQPHKSVSVGRCCKCLAVKDFKNSLAVDKGGWGKSKASEKQS